jgi:hypothetical protein
MVRSFYGTVRFAGFLVVVLGIASGLAPFFGPLADDSLDTSGPWRLSEDRVTLHVAPAAAAALGGLILLLVGARAFSRVGSLFAMTAGAWLIVAPSLQPLWETGGRQLASATQSETRQALEEIGYYYGVGALILALAACALGLLFTTAKSRRFDQIVEIS